MRFRMLGQLQVFDGDVAVPIRGAKQRMLLLLLLVRARETVQSERLADELWGDDPPAGGANALQALVSKLRRALGPLSDVLSTGAGGYRIDVEDDEIDARCFESAANKGREALVAGEAITAASACRRALALWRGPALDGSDDEGILRREAGRLEELRWGALEDRIDADLQSGRNVELVGELEQLVAEAPLRERFHGFLMLALYRAGRQAEALRAYQHARTVLGEELGLEPGPELRDLESAILDQDSGLLLSTRTPSGVPGRRTNITEGLSPFIGREDELEVLGRLVATNRLVTIVGPGGAGKTRLAQELARSLLDRDAFLVELAPVQDPAAVPDAVALGIGLPELGLGQGDGSAGLDRLVEHLADRPTIVVVDNCEHVIAAAARIVEQLLVRSPLLRVLATSREALGLGGETIWPVPPLAMEDAIDLFNDRAASSSADGALDASSAVEDVCTRLDGLPLAIELAAARVRVIPVQQLADRLDDRFRLLTGGARTAMPRQQTLRAVVEWSYDLLFDDERQVFDMLSVFAGGCSLEAAEAVCSGDQIEVEDVADLLAHLVDKSLAIATHSGGRARFDLLQTLALFGRERLASSKVAKDVRDRHAAHYLALAERGSAAFHGEDQVGWLAEISRETDNLRAALAWFIDQQHAEAAHRLVGGMGWIWWMGGNGEEGLRWFDAALSSSGSVDPRTRAHALTWACGVGTNSGQGVELAIRRGEEAVALLRDVDGDDRLSLADACQLLALAHTRPAQHDRALELFDEAVALNAESDDRWSRAVGASAAGLAAGLRGDLQAALAHHLESMEHFEAIGVEWAVANVGSDIAQVVEARGDLDAAVAFTERALLAARKLNLQLSEIHLGARLGNLLLCQGDVEGADALHEEAMVLAEAVGSRVSYGVIFTGRAMVRWAQGRLQEAAEAAADALAVYRRTELLSGQALSLALLGFMTERLGDVSRAEELHTEALGASRQLGDQRLVALALEGLAGVAVARGDHERGATLLGQAGHLRDLDGAPSGPASDEVRIGQVIVEALGAERFDDLRRLGRAADIDALVH